MKDKKNEKKADELEKESEKIHKWYGSAAVIIIERLIFNCKRIGKFVNKLIVKKFVKKLNIKKYAKKLNVKKFVKKLNIKKSSGLPKIEIEEPKSIKKTTPTPVQTGKPPASSNGKGAATRIGEQRKTTFKYSNQEAKEVKIVGDFTNWETIPMHKDSYGEWQVMVELMPDKYTYKFVVDGEWITDPKNTKLRPDGYGGKISVIEVKEPEP